MALAIASSKSDGGAVGWAMPKEAGGPAACVGPWEPAAGPLGAVGWDPDTEFAAGRPRLRLGASPAGAGGCPCTGSVVTFCANGATFVGRGAAIGGGAKVAAGAPPFEGIAAR